MSHSGGSQRGGEASKSSDPSQGVGAKPVDSRSLGKAVAKLTVDSPPPSDKRSSANREPANAAVQKPGEDEQDDEITDGITAVDLLLSSINRLSIAAVNVSGVSRIVERLRGAAAAIVGNSALLRKPENAKVAQDLLKVVRDVQTFVLSHEGGKLYKIFTLVKTKAELETLNSEVNNAFQQLNNTVNGTLETGSVQDGLDESIIGTFRKHKDMTLVIWVHSNPEKLLERQQKWESEVPGLFFLNKNSLAQFTKFADDFPDLWSVDCESRVRIAVSEPGENHKADMIIHTIHTLKKAAHVPIVIDPADETVFNHEVQAYRTEAKIMVAKDQEAVHRFIHSATLLWVDNASTAADNLDTINTIKESGVSVVSLSSTQQAVNYLKSHPLLMESQFFRVVTNKSRPSADNSAVENENAYLDLMNEMREGLNLPDVPILVFTNQDGIQKIISTETLANFTRVACSITYRDLVEFGTMTDLRWAPPPAKKRDGLGLTRQSIVATYAPGKSDKKQVHANNESDQEPVVVHWGLAIGDPRRLKLPIRVRFQRIAAGPTFSLGLTDDGSVWSWGNGKNGVLGNGSSADKFQIEPLQVKFPENTRISCIATGWKHCAAISDVGVLYTWGSKSNSRLGFAATADQLVPAAVTAAVQFKEVALAETYNVAISTDGLLFQWGDILAKSGRTKIIEPTEIACDATKNVFFKQIDAGKDHIIALSVDSRVWCWGSTNSSGELGRKSGAFYLPAPIDESLADVTMVCAGSRFCAVVSAGTVIVWGAADKHQAGVQEKVAKIGPTQLKFGPLVQISSISLGRSHGLAISTDSQLYRWGSKEVASIDLNPISQEKEVQLSDSQANLGHSAAAEPSAFVHRVREIDGLKVVAAAAGYDTCFVQAIPRRGAEVRWKGSSRGISCHNTGDLKVTPNGPPDATTMRCLPPMSKYAEYGYFEVEIVNIARPDGSVVVGLTPDAWSNKVVPGHVLGSVGFDATTGSLWNGGQSTASFGKPCGAGDVIGVGINFANNNCVITRNGEVIGQPFNAGALSNSTAFPAVSIAQPTSAVSVNLGNRTFLCNPRSLFPQEDVSKRFELVKKIGKGNAAVAIVRERYGEDKTTKILKTISFPYDNVGHNILQATKEALTSKKFKHTNLVHTFDAWAGEHFLDPRGAEFFKVYLLMEFCSGGDLGNVPLPGLAENVLRNSLRQIVLGLQYIHVTHKKIHRDIKPDNFFKSSEELVKLGDYGSVVSVKSKTGKLLEMCGTEGFQAPEVLEVKFTKQPYNEKIDIFSLGISVVELACGRRSDPMFPIRYLNAVRGDERTGVKGLPDKEAKKTLLDRLKHCSKDLIDLVDKMTASDPAQRPSCADILRHPFLFRLQWRPPVRDRIAQTGTPPMASTPTSPPK